MAQTKPVIVEGELFLEDLEAIINAIPVPGKGIRVTAPNVWSASGGGGSDIVTGWTAAGAPGRSGNALGVGAFSVTVLVDGNEFFPTEDIVNMFNRSVDPIGANRYVKCYQDGGEYINIWADCHESEPPPMLPPPNPPDPPDPGDTDPPVLPGPGTPPAGVTPVIPSFEGFVEEAYGIS